MPLTKVTTMTPETFIDHEIRIRLVEQGLSRIERLLYWILGTIIIGVALPVSLHAYGYI